MKKQLLAAITAVLALAAPLAHGASDYLLELDGIKGESKDTAHPGTIEIESFSWGASNPTASASGGGGGAGKVVFQDIHFVIHISKASPQMLMACATGQVIPRAVLYGRKSGGDGAQYMTITLSDVLVSSYSSAGANPPTAGAASTLPVDSIKLSFTRVQMSYTAEDGTTSTGSAGDPPAAQ
jgi:type VI secretion system secreted protein Hcp